ncbi:MAG TPA: FAD-dependent oxidoreductase [Parafilimonas sp.]|nr:FAD-dependent oxidoreductase [Parafilimonas sp.]
MKLTGGYPFSLINHGLLNSYPKLLKDISANTVIIGGGISGALTAYYLINAGIECIMVDSRSIGLGSTCASTSLLQYELDIPLHLLKRKIGDKDAERIYQLCGNSIDTLIQIMDNIGFTEHKKTGSLFFSAHHSEKKFMHDEFAARKKAGFDVSFLSAYELKDEYGLKGEYAILSRQGCVADAYALTHALLQDCIKKGLQVFDRTHVTNIQYKGNVVLQTAEGCRIKAKNIINATGYEVINFLPKGIVDFDCTYAIVSEQSPEALPYWKDNVMMWNTDDPYLYMRLTKDNRIIVGGRDERFSNAFTRQVLIEKKSKQLEKDFHKALPGLAFKREFEWSGTFGKTKDSLPYIGPFKKTPNTYYALGFGGNGITFSVIAAEIIRDLLCGKQNPDARFFSFER